MRRKGLKAPDGTYNLSLLNFDKATDPATGLEGLKPVGNYSRVTADRRQAGLDSNSQSSQSPIIKKTKTFAIER